MKTSVTQMALAIAMYGMASASVFAATPNADEASGAVPTTVSSGTILLAKKGRGGADDPAPGCDDHGTDICNVMMAKKGRGGMDDPVPEPGCDDHGTDVCHVTLAKKGRGGNDDPVPEPGCDDHGTDICAATEVLAA